jgi:hypothetical protein
VQTCDASQIQTIPNRNNTAVVLQVIISQNPPSPQDGTGIAQYVKQSLGPGTPEDTEEGDSEPDAPGSQKQESHQTVTVSCPLAISGGKSKGPGVIGS